MKLGTRSALCLWSAFAGWLGAVWGVAGRRRAFGALSSVCRGSESVTETLAWVSSGQRPPREEGLPAGGVRVRREVPSQEEAHLPRPPLRLLPRVAVEAVGQEGP